MFKANLLLQLRESKNLSQDDLAQMLKISRPSYAAIEQGRKELTISQAQTLCDFFAISLNDFIHGRVLPLAKVRLAKSKKKTKKSKRSKKLFVRISVPQEKVEVFTEILLYILNKVGAWPNVGQTVLYKLLYFIDFDYYELYEQQLIGAKYIRNHYGPTPVAFAKIVEQMKQDGELEEVKSDYFNHLQTKYLPRRKADLTKIGDAQAIKHVDEVLDRLANKSAQELSNLSHQDVPWITAQPEEIIDYEAVFYRTDKTSVKGQSEAEV